MDQEEQILRLQSLFRGNSRIIGQASNDLIQDPKDPNKLNQSKRGFAQGPATDVHWKKHLDGEVSLGLVPIDDYQKVKFMAIDVDLDIMEELKVTLHSLAAQVEANGMPFVVCRSKSGAAHLYVFFNDSVDVAPVRKTIQRMADYMGMKTGASRPVEFFPHTSKLDKESNGKYINLPYFNASDTVRYGLDNAGNQLNLTEFIHHCESKMVSATTFNKWKTPASDEKSIRDVVGQGPPCLQTIYDQGLASGTKNDILFQFGILFKRYNKDTFEENVHIINQTRCDPPHDEHDLENTLKSIRKKDFRYNCAHVCLSPICAKSLCMTRKYGIKAAVEFPDVKEIIQWGASDEYFEIVLSKTEEREEVKFKIEASLMLSFEAMQSAVLQSTHIVVPTPKKFEWQEFVMGLSAKIRRVAVPKEFSVEAAIRSLIIAYASSRTLGTKMEDLLVKKPVKQEEMIYIRHKDIQEKILQQRYPGYIDGLEYSVVMNDLGGQLTVQAIGNEKFSVFVIPDPKINQEEILNAVATDFESKY